MPDIPAARAYAQRGFAAADILDDAADHNLPMPGHILVAASSDLVKISLNSEADLRAWVEFNKGTDADIKPVDTTVSDLVYLTWTGTIYDQPVELAAAVVISIDVDWDTPVRDDYLPAQRGATL